MAQDDGIQQWRPPDDFENPVPEPGEKRRRLREKLSTPETPSDGWGIDEDAWDAAQPEEVRPIVALARSAAAIIGIFAVLHFGLPALLDRIDPDDAAGKSNTTIHAADGRSQLPGGRATLKYEPLPGQREKVNVGYSSNGKPAWTGTMWALVTPNERSFITLFEMKFDPILGPDMLSGALPFFNSNVASEVGRPVAYRTEEMDGREAWVWRVRHADGTRELFAWVVDRQYGHRLQCQAAVSEPDVWRQCRDALQNVRFPNRA